MKISIEFVVLFALFGLIQSIPVGVKETGDLNNKLIDRETTYAVADPHGYVSKTFTFPPVRSNFEN